VRQSCRKFSNLQLYQRDSVQFFVLRENQDGTYEFSYFLKATLMNAGQHCKTHKPEYYFQLVNEIYNERKTPATRPLQRTKTHS
jgi:hypothetical protein